MRIQVQAIEFTADQKLLAFIEKRVQKLFQLFDKITSVNIYLRLNSKGKQVNEKIVEVKVNVPGSQLFAREEKKVFEVATDEALRSIQRQLKRHKEKNR